MKKHKCEECKEELCCDSYYLCEACCEHCDKDKDDRICLDCGKDLTEYYMGLAEYAADMAEDR